MEVEQVSVKGADGLYASVTVTIKNNGTQIARLAFEKDPPLGVFSVEYSSDQEPKFEKKQTLRVRAPDPNSFASGVIVRPGQTAEIPFLINLLSPGWYFVAFGAVLSEQDRKMLIETGVPEDRIVSWTTKKYVHVSGA